MLVIDRKPVFQKSNLYSHQYNRVTLFFRTPILKFICSRLLVSVWLMVDGLILYVEPVFVAVSFQLYSLSSMLDIAFESDNVKNSKISSRRQEK